MPLANFSLPLIAYASGIAAGDTGCADGPIFLQQANLPEKLISAKLSAYWKTILKPQTCSTKLATVAEICQRLAAQTQILSAQKQKFAVLAGDHSCAIGTWSGVFANLQQQSCVEHKECSMGLIWIDAHMDSHTFATTRSGNIHGMPLAVLLGHGASELTQILTPQPKLKPEHVSLIGVRSYEAGEAALLQRLGVRIYMMKEVQQRGSQIVLQEAITRAKQDTHGFGVSLDLDAIDPQDAPGVGSPAVNGLYSQEILDALKQLAQDPNFIGIELAEFNPHHDREHKTEILIKDLLVSTFGT